MPLRPFRVLGISNGNVMGRARGRGCRVLRRMKGGAWREGGQRAKEEERTGVELRLGEGGYIRMQPGVRSQRVPPAYVSSASVNLLRSLQGGKLTEREGRGRLGTCCRCSSSSGPAPSANLPALIFRLPLVR